jgi:hypothetical protein
MRDDGGESLGKGIREVVLEPGNDVDAVFAEPHLEPAPVFVTQALDTGEHRGSPLQRTRTLPGERHDKAVAGPFDGSGTTKEVFDDDLNSVAPRYRFACKIDESIRCHA